MRRREDQGSGGRPRTPRSGSVWLALALSVALGAASLPAEEAEEARCFGLCAPELDFEPTFTVDNLFVRPRVQDLATGAITRLERDTAFEAILALGVPTEVPFLELTLEIISSPFTDDNEVELEAELNFGFLPRERSGGWVEAHFDLVDQFSPRERPTGDSSYTHKFDLELDVAFYPFQRLRNADWLRDLPIEVSLDYLASGLPRRGDVVDGLRYLDDASGWSLSLLVATPVAPLRR